MGKCSLFLDPLPTGKGAWHTHISCSRDGRAPGQRCMEQPCTGTGEEAQLWQFVVTGLASSETAAEEKISSCDRRIMKERPH